MPSLSAHLRSRGVAPQNVVEAAANASVEAERTGGGRDGSGSPQPPPPPPLSAGAGLEAIREAPREASPGRAGSSSHVVLGPTSGKAKGHAPPSGGASAAAPQEVRPPRLYRQPDGTLGEARPPRKPYVVAARREWADLVHYARTHGGDPNATAGRCARYGVGVLYAEHRRYLEAMGMEPETNPDGSWVGYDPSRVNPLDDPEHPFNDIVRRGEGRRAEET